MLRDCADLQSDVSPKLVVYLERNAGVGVGLETRGGYCDLVRAGLQRKKVVRAICGRRALLAHIRLHVHDSDLSAGNHRLSRITNRARNRAGYVSARSANAEDDNKEY